MTPMRMAFGKLLGVLVIGSSFTAGWFLIDLQLYVQAPLTTLAQPLVYRIEPGAGLIAVTRDLARRGVLEHPGYLVWYARWEGTANDVKAGEYEFAPGITPARLLEKLVAGDVVQYALTIPEGWSFRQVLAAVGRHEKLRHMLSGLGDDEIMAALGAPGQHPEGRFFPDTYRFSADTSDAAFLKRAFEAMEKRLASEWEQRDEGLPYGDPYEALILASIVEKETAVPEERGAIAGVFVRRLQRGMRLQTDPTVIYGLGEEFDGNLTRSDLREDSPYNTYTQAGLPPTPIAMPGAASLHAALHPTPGAALYFVARGDGTHQFSETVEEHNRAVRRYQLQRSDRGE